MMTLDVTVFHVALGPVAHDLGAGLDRVQWTVSGYSLAFGALLLTAGALSDRIGRRAVFLAGMSLFTAASVLCGLAPTVEFLIASRVVQGVGGALAFAPTLALLAAAYPPERRARAIAAYAAAASAAGAAGPLVGGVLVELLGWRWVFLVNVPFGLLVVAGTWWRMAETASPGARRRVDPGGALLAVAALLALNLALASVPEAGWSSGTVVGSASAAVLLGLAFAFSQRRGDGLVDLALLRRPAFLSAAALGFLGRMAGLGTLAFIALWLQGAGDLTPMRTGAALLPLTGSLLVMGMCVGRLQAVAGPAALVSSGFALKAAGLLSLAAAGADTGWVVATAGMVLLGCGGALVFPPLMGVAVAAVPPERAGMASGITNACYPLGTAAGVAVFGALFTARIGREVPGAEDRAATESGRLGELAPSVRPVAEAAVGGAMTTVCLAAAAVCVAGALGARLLGHGATGTAPAEPRPPGAHPVEAARTRR